MFISLLVSLFISMLISSLYFLTISSVIILILLSVLPAIDPFLSILPPCLCLRRHKRRLDFHTIPFFLPRTMLLLRRRSEGHIIGALEKRVVSPSLKRKILHFLLIQTILQKLGIDSKDNMRIGCRFHERNIKHLLSMFPPAII